MAPKGPNNPNHPFRVTVRTLAGHTIERTVKPADTVSELADEAVKLFVSRGQLAAGEYALTLPRLGTEAELDPTASLDEVDVTAGDVLVLVDRKPQVDG